MSVKVDLTLFDEANSLLAPPRPSPLLSALEDIEKAMVAKAATAKKTAPAPPSKAGGSLKDELKSLGDLESLKKDAMAIPADLLALLDQKTTSEEVKKHLWGYDLEDMEKHLKSFSGSSLYADAAALIADIFRSSAQLERLDPGEWNDLIDTYIDPDGERRKELKRKRDRLFADLQDLTARMFAERAERAAKDIDVIKGFGEAGAEPKTKEDREDAAPTAAPSVEGDLSPAEAKEKEEADAAAKAEERGEDQGEKGDEG